MKQIFCLLPWKNSRTVILNTQKGKSLQKAHIRNNPAYVGLSAEARAQAAPEFTCSRNINKRVLSHLSACTERKQHTARCGSSRPSHKHIHIFPHLLVQISWCARCVTEESEANARQGERDGRMHPLLCFEWTGPHRRPLGAPSLLHHLSVSLPFVSPCSPI